MLCSPPLVDFLYGNSTPVAFGLSTLRIGTLTMGLEYGTP